MTIALQDRWPGRKRVVFQLAAAPCAFAFVFAIAQLARLAGFDVAICLAKQLAGIPCPGCGITTSIGALIDGRIKAALDANIAGPVVMLFFVLQVALAVMAAFTALNDQRLLSISRLNGQALSLVLFVVWLSRIAIR
ncbi:MAG TPA: DUF2752 domain-containing protein [Thermoanaerobaculia bacterium]